MSGVKIVSLFVLAGILVAHCLFAQSQLLNYQGRLTDANGVPITGAKDLRFSLYEQPTGGSAKWTEPHYGVVVTDGVFNVLLGGVDPVAYPLAPSLFSSDELYLGVAVDGAEMTPRFRLAGVPFALKAEQANTVREADFVKTHQKVSFSAFLSPATPLSGNRIMDFKHVAFNYGGAYDSLTSTFTVPIKGVYLFNLIGLSDGNMLAGGWFKWTLRVNGSSDVISNSEVEEGRCISWHNPRETVSRTLVLPLEKGDKVNITQTDYNSNGYCDNFRSGWSGVLLYADPEE